MARNDSIIQQQLDILRGTNAPAKEKKPIEINADQLALFVGLVALMLPTVLLLFSLSPQFCFYDSISHFYFAPFLGSYFVGCLGFIALFLFAYQGNTRSDKYMSILAGVAAIGVAIFPTSGAGCDYSFTEIARVFTPFNGVDNTTHVVTTDISFMGIQSQTIHMWSARILFGVLAWFCLVSFRRNNGSGVSRNRRAKKDESKYVKTAAKKRRNFVYLICGAGMLFCILWMIMILSEGHATNNQSIFWPETIALYLFGFSWLVKSKVIKFLAD